MIRLQAELVDRSAGVGRYPFTSVLLKLSERLQDWREFFTTVFIPRYTDQIQQNFETEGELSGFTFGWPGLSPEYAQWKSRHFPGTKILERTRRLRESLAPGASGPDTVLEAGPTWLKYGTRVPYARFHDDGGPVIPRRPIMPRVVIKEWTPAIRQWVLERSGE